MKAYCLKHSGKKGWQIVLKRMKCDQEKLNLITEGDVQSDDWTEIVKLSQGFYYSIDNRAEF